jgi:antitoxin MazE
MVTTIRKWGNSQGLRLARQVMEDARLEVGDEVDVAVRDGAIVIRPARRVRGAQDLRKLVADMPAAYRPKEGDWGAAAGNEVW